MGGRGRGRGYGRSIHLVAVHLDAARLQVVEHDEQELGDGLGATGGLLIAVAEAVPRPSAEELVVPQIERKPILLELSLHPLSAVIAQMIEQPPLPRRLRQVEPCHMEMTEMRAASSLPENRQPLRPALMFR